MKGIQLTSNNALVSPYPELAQWESLHGDMVKKRSPNCCQTVADQQIFLQKCLEISYGRPFTRQIAHVFHSDDGESHSLEILKNCLDIALSNMFQETLLEQGGWTRWPPMVPSNFNHSVILIVTGGIIIFIYLRLQQSTFITLENLLPFLLLILILDKSKIFPFHWSAFSQDETEVFPPDSQEQSNHSPCSTALGSDSV